MTHRPRAAARTAPIELWRIAEALLHMLHNIFGPPEHVAARRTLAPNQHRLFHAWITAAENLMRRLLLLEARACVQTATPSADRAASQARRTSPAFDPENPDSWRVSFVALAQQRRRTAPRRRTHAPFPYSRLYLTRPLAERIEALIRVFNDPAPYARRLARRLNTKPKRAGELTGHCRYMARFLDPGDIAAIDTALAWPPPAPDTS